MKTINDVMEQYLWSYVTNLKHDWEDCLPVGEFSKNNADSEAAGISLFFENYTKIGNDTGPWVSAGDGK